MCRVMACNAICERYKPSMNLDNETESADEESDSLYVYESDAESTDDDEAWRSEDGSDHVNDSRRTDSRSSRYEINSNASESGANRTRDNSMEQPPSRNSNRQPSSPPPSVQLTADGGIEVRATCSFETYPVGSAPAEEVGYESENVPPYSGKQPQIAATDPLERPENFLPYLPDFPEVTPAPPRGRREIPAVGVDYPESHPTLDPRAGPGGEHPECIPNPTPAVEKPEEAAEVQDVGDSGDDGAQNDKEGKGESTSRLRKFRSYTYALIGISVVAIAAGAAKRFYSN